jgi:hypothetical protein
MKRLLMAGALAVSLMTMAVLPPLGTQAHTSETRVINGRCQIRYITIFTIHSGQHGHLTYSPWYFMPCHW